MKRVFTIITLLILLFMGIISCDKGGGEKIGPQIVTLGVDKGPFMVVLLSGRVSGLEGVAIDFNCGIEYSIDESFIDKYTTRQNANKKYTEDSFSITVTDIQPGKKYYYRAYYINQQLIYYGEVKSFTFEWSEIEIARGPVDLGLSVKWATCNVGATVPEEYGDYYRWGETEPKADYYAPYYKYYNNSSRSFTKYNCNSSYGPVDNKMILELEDDAANVNWGGNWRMPTEDEFYELMINCTWKWTTLNGVNGYKVTSNIDGYNNCSIFLPASSYHSDGSVYEEGTRGTYWTSLLSDFNPFNAHLLYFYCSDTFNHHIGNAPRQFGQSVRPVCP